MVFGSCAQRTFGAAAMPVAYAAAVGLFIIALSVLTFRNFEKPMRDWLSGRRPSSAPGAPQSGSPLTSALLRK